MYILKRVSETGLIIPTYFMSINRISGFPMQKITPIEREAKSFNSVDEAELFLTENKLTQEYEIKLRGY